MYKNSSDLKNILSIIGQVQEKNTHDEIYNFIVERLLMLFDVDVVLHFHHNKDFALIVNEAYKDFDKNLIDKNIDCLKAPEKIISSYINSVFIVNNVDSDIRKACCKDYWHSKGINSFLLYFPGALELSRKDIEVVGGTVLISFSKRGWSVNEIDAFKIIMDTVTSIYKGIKEKREVEESRSNYIATLTHDLRTPIISSQKALEYILSQDRSLPVSQFKDFLEGMNRVNEDLLLLINNLLSLYHIEAEGFHFIQEEFDIKELVNESIGMIDNLTLGGKSKITKKIKGDIPLIKASRRDIKKVMVNFLSNAIKHNQQGVKVVISAEQKGNNIEVCVTDDGKGVSEDTKKVIFERYSSSNKKIGSGLGLYLSKQIIEAHEGSLYIESQVNKGAKFCFTIPVNRKD